ncbi:MAG: GrpB family protein [Velocimicrobium sp.]
MSKPLSEMSLEELWQLFPIQLTQHQTYWKDWYETEKDCLLLILSDTVKIHHIGSTSIDTIWAKPIIDILVEADLSDFNEIKRLLLDNGYQCMAENGIRIDFNKGYTPDGFSEKVYHLHLRKFGDNDELYFRDYLNKYPEIAKAYEELKLSLWKPYEHNRDGYTDSKSEFVNGYTRKAKIHYSKFTNKMKKCVGGNNNVTTFSKSR